MSRPERVRERERESGVAPALGAPRVHGALPWPVDSRWEDHEAASEGLPPSPSFSIVNEQPHTGHTIENEVNLSCRAK